MLVIDDFCSYAFNDSTICKRTLIIDIFMKKKIALYILFQIENKTHGREEFCWNEKFHPEKNCCHGLKCKREREQREI